MIKEKSNIKLAVKTGVAAGFIGTILLISAISVPNFKENYEINQIRNNNSKRINISEYHSIKNAEYVCMFKNNCTKNIKLAFGGYLVCGFITYFK